LRGFLIALSGSGPPKKYLRAASGGGGCFEIANKSNFIEQRNQDFRMASPYRTQILAQIRVGRRSWSHAEVAGDCAAFRTQVVEPLRQLKYDGIVQALSEIESSREDRIHITCVTIIGGVSDQPRLE
jgi:hypothetical protein